MLAQTTFSARWLPDVFYSSWTWLAIVISFLLGAAIVWFITRKILITGAIGIAMAYLTLPAGRLIVNSLGLEVEVPEQGTGAAVVACVVGGLMLVVELVTRWFDYRKTQSLENLLNRLREMLRGKSQIQRRVVIDGLLLASSDDKSTNSELIEYLDTVESTDIRAIRTEPKRPPNAQSPEP